MGDFLRADVDALDKAVQLLRGSEQVLTDAMNAMKAAGHGDIGPKILNDAADRFQRRWHYGLDRIGAHAKDMANGVSQCRDAYLDADQALAEALNRSRGALSQPVPSPGDAAAERVQ
ncbi:hypothetical protein G4X40_21065 [Rhodococcus sp. D2-41]|uniref:hypothetical protein n=1 Tax=Speluncibacter jeojiensis TaxID=2710754 RepID=UPI0024101488|nr:hypothetical protein [Rhodococcus sp. D2-41]MDG3012635.1 hypothetical protein [Rhodococcus sp. D2-41]